MVITNKCKCMTFILPSLLHTHDCQSHVAPSCWRYCILFIMAWNASSFSCLNNIKVKTAGRHHAVAATAFALFFASIHIATACLAQTLFFASIHIAVSAFALTLFFANGHLAVSAFALALFFANGHLAVSASTAAVFFAPDIVVVIEQMMIMLM